MPKTRTRRKSTRSATPKGRAKPKSKAKRKAEPKPKPVALVSAGAVFHALMSREAGTLGGRWKAVATAYPELREEFTEEERASIRDGIGLTAPAEAKFAIVQRVADLVASGSTLGQARMIAGERYPSATMEHRRATWDRNK